MKRNQLTSKRLNPNLGIMEWYSKELVKLTSQMTKECERELTKIYKKGFPEISFSEDELYIKNQCANAKAFINGTTAMDESISSQARIALNALYKKYGDKFSKKAKVLAESLLNKTNKYANWQFLKSLKTMIGENAKGFSLKGSAITPEKEEIIKAAIFENVSLIKSIHSEYFKQITGAVARSIENGDGLKYLSDELLSFGAKSRRRADLIAQDQTRKAYTSINLRNFQEAGLKKFKWVHSGGSREPRLYHKNVLDGQIFDIEKGAPNEDNKKPPFIYPGQLPYCRCVMQAVLDFED